MGSPGEVYVAFNPWALEMGDLLTPVHEVIQLRLVIGNAGAGVAGIHRAEKGGSTCHWSWALPDSPIYDSEVRHPIRGMPDSRAT